MKKIFLLLLLFITAKAFAQFPAAPAGSVSAGTMQYFVKILSGDTTLTGKDSHGNWYPFGRTSGSLGSFINNSTSLQTSANFNISGLGSAIGGLRIGDSTSATNRFLSVYRLINGANVNANFGHTIKFGGGAAISTVDNINNPHALVIPNQRAYPLFTSDGGVTYHNIPVIDTYVGATLDTVTHTLTVTGGGSSSNADSLGHHEPAYYLNRANHTGSQAESTVTNLVTDLAGKEPVQSGTGYVKSASGTKSYVTAIPNADLVNSSTTINGTPIALGASGTVTAAPSGSAGGDLAGTYPNPTVNQINSITKSFYDPTSSIQTQLNTKMASLVVQSVKTTGYTAAARDFVPVNTTSGSVTVTLPIAPADGTLIGVKHIIQGSSNTVSIITGGTDVFNKTSGGTSLTLTLLNQGALLQYNASGGIWYVLSDDLSLAQLDLRYAAIGGGGGVSSVTSNGSGLPSITGTALNIPPYGPGVWTPYGTTMSADLTADQSTLQEPVGLYESGAQLIANTTGSVFKIMYTAGYGTPNIMYAESLDGLTWVRYGTIGIANHARPYVIKVGSTYYCFCVPLPSALTVDVYSSSDMKTWTLVTAGIITAGGVGTWNHSGLGNLAVYYDGTTFHMLLSGVNGSPAPFTTGYYSSTSIGSGWTQGGSNPILGSGTLEVAPGYFTKIGSTYWMWGFGGGAGTLPTDIRRYSSSSPSGGWALSPSGITFARSTADEGPNTSNGQVANPFPIEAAGKTYLFYVASPDGSTTGSHIKTAIYNGTMANLVLTSEGNANMLTMAQPATYDQNYINANFVQYGTTYNPTGGSSIYMNSVAGSGDGFRVRDATATTTLSLLGPGSLFLFTSGNSNSITGGNTSMTLTGHGGFTFNNSSTGPSTLGTIDGTGLLTVPNGFSTSGAGTLNITPTPFTTVDTYGITLRNQTSTSSGTPVRNSMEVYQNSASWNTGSSSSQIHEFVSRMEPFSGATTGFNYVWRGTVNNNFGSYTTLLKLGGASGDLTPTGNLITLLGKELKVTEGTGGFAGQVALVSGTKAITITGVTTSSRAFVTLVTPSGTTLTTAYQAVCTSNTLTLQANIDAGTINTADASTLNYFIIN